MRWRWEARRHFWFSSMNSFENELAAEGVTLWSIEAVLWKTFQCENAQLMQHLRDGLLSQGGVRPQWPFLETSNENAGEPVTRWNKAALHALPDPFH